MNKAYVEKRYVPVDLTYSVFNVPGNPFGPLFTKNFIYNNSTGEVYYNTTSSNPKNKIEARYSTLEEFPRNPAISGYLPIEYRTPLRRKIYTWYGNNDNWHG